MATKIRLQRHGKKGKPYYYIVATDSRVKRDGKYIERLGDYNPNTNPAIINLDFERALHWVKTGAQPTDTARAILSYKGVMMKNHLDKGVLKGAHSQDQANKKFEKWMSEKASKIDSKVEGLKKSKEQDAAKKLAAEKEINEKRIAEIQAKEAELHAAAEAEMAQAEEPVKQAETAAEPMETPEATETVENKTEEKAEEAQAVAEEAPVADVPAEEEKKED